MKPVTALLLSLIPAVYIAPFLLAQGQLPPETAALSIVLREFSVVILFFAALLSLSSSSRQKLQVRLLGWAALGVCAFSAHSVLLQMPQASLIFFSFLALSLFLVGEIIAESGRKGGRKSSKLLKRDYYDTSAEIATGYAVALVAITVFFGMASSVEVQLAGLLSLAFAYYCIGNTLVVYPKRPKVIVIFGTLIFFAPLVMISAMDGRWGISGLLLIIPLALFFVLPAESVERNSRFDFIFNNPARSMVFTFVWLIFLGTLLLASPFSSARAASIGLIDAFFTSVSAVCVTGLVVLDTAGDFSLVGEGIILMLIQLGGLGIMAFYAAALGAFRKRPSLRHEIALADASGDEDRTKIFQAVQRMFFCTFGVEALGAVILTYGFSRAGLELPKAIWTGLFTAVSAFCNAGFALQADNLLGFQHDPLVLYTVAVLIVLGGLSPVVVFSIPAFVRRKKISLRAKITLMSTLTLIVAGFFLYLLFEWDHTLAHLSLGDKIHNAIFQSVTTRTAGFNSVDITGLRSASLTMMMVLMFIGGSPGGTAGGVKTTTIFVLLSAIFSLLRSRSEVEAFGRTISRATVYRAIAIVLLGIATAVSALIALQLTQEMPFDVLLFEIISAIGTVGLSIGGTLMLDEPGKIVIAVCMFLGRIGPLTFLMLFASDGSAGESNLPEGSVPVG
ncbi:MAG: TrkH family potassium uptake protein [bacterium]|nr:TrkH family potassium uptake protein [bacterium]